MVLILLLLLCNYDNLILKLHHEKNFLDEVWIFIGSFKVRSVPGMINKEVLAQFIYKYITDERGWVIAQILLTNC